ncbi:LAFE_0E07118g1_1 [Lachancea fermentati]|uniref:LAFE_0E07118g1_1 n=1 Tax=Lachancea fermentati TaxID=4955 RepID=A0A1G4MD22_LACFM|nr:LAFE_0E07118g1_1 [Lachancea fermentati]
MSTMSTHSKTVPFAVGGAESQSVTLPPISSFDNLIRAAEEQYTLHSSSVSPALPAREQLGNIFSYQLGGSAGASAASSVSSSAGTGGSGSGAGDAAVVGGGGAGADGAGSSPVNAASAAYHLPGHVSPTSVSSDTAAAAAAAVADAEAAQLLPPAAALDHSHAGYAGRGASFGHVSHAGVPLQHQLQQPLSPLQRSLSVDSARVGKPRRKKECPVCHHFYANLSTHKSTHLTPENRPHKCPICLRGFARNNDLLRHRKRHWKDEIIGKPEPAAVVTATAKDVSQEQLKSLHQIKGTFKCPFNSTLIGLDMEMYPQKKQELAFETSNCHQTGVFSRCDTFKNHLKALHFEYPPGTKKKDRATVHGRCKHCGGKFANVDEWLNEHVGKTCGYVYH